jgi:hypothetical protein
MLALAFKAIVAIFASLCGLAVLRLPHLYDMPEKRFQLLAAGLQLIPTLGLFVALYVVGHQDVTADVPAYYVPAARSVLQGQIPLRDFLLSYGPLFPYVGAALLSIWNSGKAFALFAVLINVATLLMWHSVARSQFDARTARQTSVLFAASGQVMVQALLGTNQAWVAAAIAGSALSIVRGRDFSSGFLQGVSLCAVKFLGLLFWPVLWMLSSSRARWLSGAVALSVLVYGAFAFNGVDLLYPLRHEGELISSANLPYFLELLSGSTPFANRLFDLLTLVTMAAVTLWIFLRCRKMGPDSRAALLLPGLALTELTFMLFSKKSFPGYILFCLYPLMWVLVQGVGSRPRREALFLAFNLLLAVESSLWFYLGGDALPLDQWLRTPHGIAVDLFLAVDLLIMACYACLFWSAIGWIRKQALSLPQQAEAVGSGAGAGHDPIALDHMQRP